MRHVAAAARALATAAMFAVALVLGAVLHVGAPAVRRVVAARVNAILTVPLEGKIVIEHIGSIGVGRVTGIDARVDDPDGVTVVRARGIDATITLLSLLRSLTSGATIAVDLPEATIAEGDVDLDCDAAGAVRLANAFRPRPSSREGRPGPSVRVSLPHVHVAHAVVHGQPQGSPPIDAEADDVDASVLVTPPTVRVDVPHARVLARSPVPAGKDARGDAEVHLTVPAPSGGVFGLRGTFRGSVAAIETRAAATYDSDLLDATVDVPAANPEAVRALVPSWPLTAPLAVHVEGRGALPRLDLRVHAVLESGAVDVTGPVFLSPLNAQLRVDARAIDPHGIVASVPPSDVSAAGAVTVTSAPSGAVTARVDLDVASGRIGAVRTPSMNLTGEVVRSAPPAAEFSARATAVVHEPGAAIEVSARLAPSRGALLLSYSGQARTDRLEGVPMLRALRDDVRGRAAASVTGTLDLRTGRIDADVSAMTEAIAVGPVSVVAIHGEAHLSGPVVEPVADLALAAEGFDAPALHLSSLQSRSRFEISRGAFHDLDLRLDEAGEEVWIRAALVRFASGELRLDDADVEGLGEPVQATVRASPSSVSVHLTGPAIDLSRVARFAHWPLVHGGKVRLDVESTINHGETDAHLTIDLAHGSVATLPDIEGHIGATLHDRQITGLASVRVADIGSLDVTSTALELGGRALDPQSWRRAWGAVDTGVHVDLARLVGVIPPGLLPLDEVRGVFDVKTRFERDSPSDVTPEINVTAQTTALALFGRRASGAAWSLQGIDPAVQATVDGQTGTTALSAQLGDASGDLVTLTASSEAVPWSVLLLGGALAPALEAMPFAARVRILPRRLDRLPRSLLFGATGEVEGTVTWQGTAARPMIDAGATLTDGVFGTRVFGMPANLAFAAHYDGASVASSLRASMRGRPVLDADATATLPAADVLASLRGAPLPWSASLAARVTELPIQGFTALDDRGMRGRATGTITVERLHDDASASAAFAFEGLKLGDIACRAANLQAKIDGHSMHATVAMDHTDGTLMVDARAGSHWGRALVPALDASQPASLSVSARAFRAAWLLPLASRVFSDLDGRIDGEASVTLDPSAGVAHPRGTLTLRDGSFEMNKLGGEFTGVSARLTLTPDGIFRFENMRANSLNGVLTAAATARLDGLAFGGARVAVEVPRTAPLPIVFDGVQMGTMDGVLDAAIAEMSDRKGLRVDLDVPKLHVALPGAAAHDVQTLGDLSGVRTGIQGEQGFMPVSLDPPAEDDEVAAPRQPIQIAVKLGTDVQVKREAGSAGQPDLAVSLEGDPVITIDDDVRASGQIRLVRGIIGVAGKPFDIEKGTVAFVGPDPSNPQVVLTAGWTAQDGTRVTASFVGPLKTGKVTLSANPAPPGGQSGILSLILFGSADQGANGNSSANANPAVGLAGSEAAAPINKALGGVNSALERMGLGGGLTTKVDTSQTNPRPEVELQIARDISLEVAWVLGLPPPGLPDTTLVTFNWRFLRKWSLLTTVGNTGTSILDVVWQHRY